MRLNGTCSYVWLLKHMSDKLPHKNGLKHGEALLPVFLNFALDYAMQKVQTNQEGLKLNGTSQLPIYANHVNLLGEIMHTVMSSTEVFISHSSISKW
jgi:hypothetical protein